MEPYSAADPRRMLLDIYSHALAAVDGRTRVRSALERQVPPGDVHLAAVGKAAGAMAEGAFDAWGESIQRALIITKYGHCHRLPPPAVCREAGHPVPDAASLRAGAELLAFVREAPADVTLLFLISGGASALAEQLSEGMDLATLQSVNDWLLASGWDIARINRVRKALSLIKGGRLARAVAGRPARVLLISDVPGDDPVTIASGPLCPDTQAGEPLPSGLPLWIEALAEQTPPPPHPSDPLFDTIEQRVIATNRDALEVAEEHGRALGLDVCAHDEPLAGEAIHAGAHVAEKVLAGPPGLHLWGGETTVTLPAEPGRGGRCQTLALAAARALDGRQDVLVLAAGTDGSDGPTEDAGALVDGGTVRRGEAEGLDVGTALERADAGRFLETSGDLIQTGPTGTNVMDLVLALKIPPANRLPAG
jgi:glycerate 2-kinase